MKKYLFIAMALLAVSLVSTEALAQSEAKADTTNRRGNRMDPAKMAEMRTKQMVEQLGLDDKQAAALKVLNDSTYKNQRFGGPRQGNGGKDPRSMSQEERQEFFKQMQAERQKRQEAYKAELKKILTDEQFAKYEQMEKERGERGGFRGGRGQGGPQGGPGRGFSGNDD